MGGHERERTFDNIVRLREAEQRASNPEVAAVREDLEAQLGGTVPRSLAARRLGVSHTTLNKWVASGDVPVLITAQGRKEVPISVLLELRERVAEERRSGGRRLHTLEPVMIEARRSADRLCPQVGPVGPAQDHQAAEQRSLAYHRVLASRLTRRMVGQARRRLDRWEAEDKIDPCYAQAWREVLALSTDSIRGAIMADDLRGRDLRQNSPFAGMLPEQERRKILASI